MIFPRLYELARLVTDLAFRREVTRCLRFLARSQHWNRRRLEEWKDFNVRRLVRHAYRTVPYYRRVMRSLGLAPSDIRTTRDLERMPILTRQDIKTNFRDMISRNYCKERMVLDHTSGSTGEPLTFYRTLHQESWGRAGELRAMQWHGVRRGNKWAWMDYQTPALHYRFVAKLSLQRGIFFNVANISEETLGWFVGRLLDTDTRLLRGEPIALHVLARFVEEQGLHLKLDVVFCRAYVLDPHVRADIERVFGCKLFDFYGCTEVGSMAAQCPGCGRYVVSDEIVHLEVMEHEDGDLGDVIVTSLVNHGMPLMRYAIGDVASGIREGCDCGRAHTTLSSIEGKVQELVARPGGRYIATLFYDAVEGMPVKQYSVVQRDYNRFTVFVVPEEAFGGGHATTIRERMEDTLGPVEVEFIEVEGLPPLPGGKHRYVFSEVPYEPPWLKAEKTPSPHGSLGPTK